MVHLNETGIIKLIIFVVLILQRILCISVDVAKDYLAVEKAVQEVGKDKLFGFKLPSIFSGHRHML